MKKVLVAVALMSSIAMADVRDNCSYFTTNVIKKKDFAKDLKKQLDEEKIPMEYYDKAYYDWYYALVVSNHKVFKDEPTLYKCMENRLCPYYIDKEVKAIETRLAVWFVNYCANYESKWINSRLKK
jgi:hypothetical protein